MATRQNLQRSENSSDDFVTVYLKSEAATEARNDTPCPLVTNTLQRRFAADKHILEQARRHDMLSYPELEFDDAGLVRLGFAIRLTGDADSGNRKCSCILQSESVKIVAEFAPYGQLVIRGFETGRPRRLTKATESAVRRLLAKKELLPTAPEESVAETFRPDREFSEESERALAGHEEILDTAYDEMVRRAELRAELERRARQFEFTGADPSAWLPALLAPSSDESRDTLAAHETAVIGAHEEWNKVSRLRDEAHALALRFTFANVNPETMLPALLVPASDNAWATALAHEDTLSEAYALLGRNAADTATVTEEIENQIAEEEPDDDGIDNLLLNAIEVIESENLSEDADEGRLDPPDAAMSAENPRTAVTTEQPEAPPADTGLRISKLVAGLGKSSSVEEIRRDLEILAGYEVRYPGILKGLAVPGYAESCAASYHAILDSKHLFIDDLNEDVLELGVGAGFPREKVQWQMAERALEVFMKGLDVQSSRTLKSSRAKKIMRINQVCGKKALAENGAYAPARKLIEEIFDFEAHRTPKPQRDHEVIRLYSDLNDWMTRQN